MILASLHTVKYLFSFSDGVLAQRRTELFSFSGSDNKTKHGVEFRHSTCNVT